MSEIWKDILGYEGHYQVSNLSRIKSLPRKWVDKERIVNGSLMRDGYIRVLLKIMGKGKLAALHRLVAIAFIPNPLNLPQVNHIDAVKTNNKLSNLEWCTQSYNITHAVKLGLLNHPRVNGERHGHAKLRATEVLQIHSLLKSGKSNVGIAELFNVSANTIWAIKDNRNWKHLKDAK